MSKLLLKAIPANATSAASDQTLGSQKPRVCCRLSTDDFLQSRRHRRLLNRLGHLLCQFFQNVTVFPHDFLGSIHLGSEVGAIRGELNAIYVRQLAKREGIVFAPTFADLWAKAVTKLAGDDVKSDKTDDLLVALTRAGKLSPRDMTRLVIAHHRNLARV